MSSILNSIKKMLGIVPEDTSFDDVILMHINTVLVILDQIGVSLKTKSVTDASSSWNGVFNDFDDLELIKTYMYAKVRLFFDPPQSSTTSTAINAMISELEWRINVLVDPKIQNGDE